MDCLKEFNELLLKDDLDPGVKLLALNEILGFTASCDGVSIISKSPVVSTLFSFISASHQQIKQAAFRILINLSATDGRLIFINCPHQDDLIQVLVREILTPDSECSDLASMLLSNVTRDATVTLDFVKPIVTKISDLVQAFCDVSNRSTGRCLDYIAMFICNISHHLECRRALIDSNKRLLVPLLPFIGYPDSSVRRQGVAGIVKNCVFDIEAHKWLLNETELLVRCLLPLAGPEEFTDEENDMLPIELQYLEGTKQREPQPAIRKILLEIVNKLCTTKAGREHLRDKNVYLILRELHKWETDPECLLTCENVVDILIRNEGEIGRDVLDDLVVPDHLVEKFREMDMDMLQPNPAALKTTTQ